MIDSREGSYLSSATDHQCRVQRGFVSNKGGLSMRRLRGIVLALAASGLIVTGLAAEGRATAAEANIWYVNPLPNTPDWGRSGKLFQDGAKANGYKATLTGPNKIDIPAMISAIEQAIADGADGIITCPLDPAAFK